MILDLNDPSSVIAWWRVSPQRHGMHLIETARRWPQFAWSIRTALRRINADPSLAPIFRSCMAHRSAVQSCAEGLPVEARSGVDAVSAHAEQALAA